MTSYFEQKEIEHRLLDVGFGPLQAARLAEGIANGHLTEADAIEQFGDLAVFNN